VVEKGKPLTSPAPQGVHRGGEGIADE
jgi:hypothetical protein